MNYETIKKAHEQYKDSEGDTRFIISGKVWAARTIEAVESGLIKLTHADGDAIITTEDQINSIVTVTKENEDKQKAKAALLSLLGRA